MQEKCPICKNEIYKTVYKNIKETQFDLKRCEQCGLARLIPLPLQIELTSYYSGTYYPSKLDDNFVGLRRNNDSAKFSKLLRRIKRFVPTDSSLLEIGCSYGFFLEKARQNGFQTAGVEYAESPARYAREKLKLSVIQGGVEKALALNKQFDIVVLSHVLEHFVEPKVELQKIFSLLRDGGLIVIRVPNLNSLTHFIQGRFWFWLLAPEHIYYFSRKNLFQLLNSLGAACLICKTEEGDFEDIITTALYALVYRLGLVSVLKRVFKKNSDSAQGASPSYSLFAKYPIFVWLHKLAKGVSLIFIPLLSLIGWFGWGSEILLIAKKRPQ